MDSEFSLVFFTSFVDLGCGLFIALAINEWYSFSETVKQRGAIATLVALALGGFSSVLHLGHPERIFGALGHPTSGIFIESSMIGITGICVIAYLYALQRNASKQALKTITLVGAITAAILAFAVGDSYVMGARPAWDTLTLPFVYLSSALLMGALAYAALLVEPNALMIQKMKRLVQALVVVQAIAIIAYLVALSSAPYSDASRSASSVLFGGFAMLFWVGIVIIGLVVPFGLVYSQSKNDGTVALSNAPFALGLMCAFVGAAVYRIIMFNLGTTVWQFF